MKEDLNLTISLGDDIVNDRNATKNKNSTKAKKLKSEKLVGSLELVDIANQSKILQNDCNLPNMHLKDFIEFKPIRRINGRKITLRQLEGDLLTTSDDFEVRLQEENLKFNSRFVIDKNTRNLNMNATQSSYLLEANFEKNNPIFRDSNSFTYQKYSSYQDSNLNLFHHQKILHKREFNKIFSPFDDPKELFIIQN